MLRPGVLVGLLVLALAPAVALAPPASGLPAGAAQAILDGRGVTLTLEGIPLTLTATPRDLLAADAFVVALDADGTPTHLPRPPTRTYVGHVAQMPDASVRFSVRDGIEGYVLMADGTGWMLLPRADGGARAVPLGAHDEPDSGGIAVPVPLAERTAAAAPDGTLTLRLALETDHALWVNNQATWQANALDLANLVEGVYAPQFGLEVEVTYLGAWTEPDPFTARFVCEQDFKLGQFQNHWIANRGWVPRDTAHLLVHRHSATGNTIGCAYIYALADDQYAYGVDRVRTVLGSQGEFLYDNVNLFSHELGHNFGGFHERSLGAYGLTQAASVPPYTIMNPTAVSGVLRFSELDGVHSPLTGWELDNAGEMLTFASSRLG